MLNDKGRRILGDFEIIQSREIVLVFPQIYSVHEKTPLALCGSHLDYLL